MNSDVEEELKENIKERVGGLDKVIDSIVKRLILYVESKTRLNKDNNEYCTSYPFQSSTIPLPNHMLVHSRTGTGKSLLVSTILDSFKKICKVNSLTIASSYLYQKDEGDTERLVSDLFSRNQTNEPFIIVFEEIDSIAPKRTPELGYIERRVSTHLLDLLSRNSRFENRNKSVFIFALTNRFNAIDKEYFMSGRFDSVISLPIPSPLGRKEIVQTIVKKFPSYLNNIEHYQSLIQYIGQCSHGFVGADLSRLCGEAAQRKIRSCDSTIDPSLVVVEKEDFDAMFEHVKPSALNEFKLSYEPIQFEDIGGLDKTIAQIKSCVLTPIMNRKPLRQMGIDPPSGVLLHGPPGTGKSLLARAIASSSPNINFISVQSTDIISPVVGESEKKLTALFRVLRDSAPAILFLDQVEVLAKKRGYDSSAQQSADRLLSCLLVEMDGMFSKQNKKVRIENDDDDDEDEQQAIIVLAATTKMELLDSTILRPGRFDYHIHVPAPDVVARHDILSKITKNMPIDPSINLYTFAEQTNGLNGADLSNICKEAALHALRRDLNGSTITLEDFKSVMNQPQSTNQQEEELLNQ
ncbi:hypothetical protein DFA_11517 [Cavenderia fasciculata]|uniref:AAA+ ATPase domain-containing protein n=1 Tax=Cavenderia fasciculata TaxID=261658 RepID=F4QDC8_CACFS|nr:uncharacterized protein DFA_11517 [Cavenderia fasciculata]EGG13756.1 hypothetical protein DFA_11517 [Cavenderia fasciculata]|eukprot:XP_004350464.1 hypothetical protein DFA_11517 [Cavenderia fasciculata]